MPAWTFSSTFSNVIWGSNYKKQKINYRLQGRKTVIIEVVLRLRNAAGYTCKRTQQVSMSHPLPPSYPTTSSLVMVNRMLTATQLQLYNTPKALTDLTSTPSPSLLGEQKEHEGNKPKDTEQQLVARRTQLRQVRSELMSSY